MVCAEFIVVELSPVVNTILVPVGQLHVVLGLLWKYYLQREGSQNTGYNRKNISDIIAVSELVAVHADTDTYCCLLCTPVLPTSRMSNHPFTRSN